MPTRITLKEKMKYWFDNTISKGTPVLIIALGLVFFITAFLTGVFVYFAHISEGDNGRMGFAESFWQSLMHVIDQGTITGESGWHYRIIMFPVSIIGILLVSTLVSILNTGFAVKLDELKKGKSLIIEDNHTIILGWSSKIFPIISELINANLNQSRSCIVVLAEKDKTEMEDEIRTKIGNTKKTKVICRSGNPKDMDDLKITNFNSAKSIIVLCPEETLGDTFVLKTLMAIINNPQRKEGKFNIICELNKDQNKDIAKIIGKDEATILIGNEIIAKITVQTSRQSGLSIVYNNLLGYDDMEIYIQEVKNIKGKKFEDLVYGFDDISVIGIKTNDGGIFLNPPMDSVLEEDDQIILIAEDDVELSYQAKNVQFPKLPNVNHILESGYEKHSTLIMGWNENTIIVLKELDNYVVAGSSVCVVADNYDVQAILDESKSQFKNQTLSFVKGDINDRNQIEKLDLKKYDHVIIMSYSDMYPVQEADAITLITLLHLRDILAKIQHRVSLVTEILDIKNRALADLSKADDFIISDRMISLILAQVSENKDLAYVFDDLFDADGNEIYIKPISNYIEHSGSYDFRSIIQSATHQGQIPFGYINNKLESDATKNYGVVLNPDKSKKIDFDMQDKLIVISEK